jgi:hypothetical protein
VGLYGTNGSAEFEATDNEQKHIGRTIAGNFVRLRCLVPACGKDADITDDESDRICPWGGSGVPADVRAMGEQAG